MFIVDLLNLPSPVVKRGRGRPPKSETEIPHTNLVRTNEMFLPLKKRHKMVMEEHAEAEIASAAAAALDAELMAAVVRDSSPAPEKAGGSRKRAAPKELEALIADEVSRDSTDSDSRKKRRLAAITSDLKSQQGAYQLSTH